MKIHCHIGYCQKKAIAKKGCLIAMMACKAAKA